MSDGRRDRRLDHTPDRQRHHSGGAASASADSCSARSAMRRQFSFLSGSSDWVSALASGAHDLTLPVLWATTTDAGGRFGGTASGFVNFASSLSGMLAPLSAAWLESVFGSFHAGLLCRGRDVRCWRGAVACYRSGKIAFIRRHPKTISTNTTPGRNWVRWQSGSLWLCCRSDPSRIMARICLWMWTTF